MYVRIISSIVDNVALAKTFGDDYTIRQSSSVANDTDKYTNVMRTNTQNWQHPPNMVFIASAAPRATYLAGELLCSVNDMVRLSAILCQITKGDHAKHK